MLVGAIALVIALGTGTYAGLLGTSAWRRQSNDASFALLNTHDVRDPLPQSGRTMQGRLAGVVAGIAHARDVTGVRERMVVPTQIVADRVQRHQHRSRRAVPRDATMLAFGLPTRTVLGLTTVETVLIGALGTVTGLAGGYALLRWMTATTIPAVLPEIGVTATLSTATVTEALAFGILTVTIAPLFTLRHLRHTDIPSTLRVME
jgi:hypothetical protein